MCCMRLVENTGRKKSPKIRYLGTIAQIYRAVSSQLRHISTFTKKHVEQQYLIYVLTIWRTSAHQRLRLVRKFEASQQISTGFSSWLRYCSDVAHRRPTKLCTMFGRLLGCYTIYTFWRLLLLTDFCQVQSSLYVQLLRSTILTALLHGTPAAGVSQSAAWYTEWNYGTFAQGATYIWLGGHHVGHRPTFQLLLFYLCLVATVVQTVFSCDVFTMTFVVLLAI